ncbi:MAG: hypothetical protein AAB652_00065 [Patescibacteria group bacterium]
MKRVLFAIAALLAFFAIFVPSTALAATKTKQTKEKDRVVMEIGPTIDLGGGVLYFPMNTMPVVMDKQDVGKRLADVSNPDTRDRLEKLAAEMYGSIGTPENARRIAESALADFPLTMQTKKDMTDLFVGDFDGTTNLSLRTPVYDTGGSCTWGQPCPGGSCGTKLPGLPNYCFVDLTCMDCGTIPK